MYTVAIVGRPNVGKSALFNRLAGKRIAIVDSTYGLTRDRVSASVSHQGARFTLVDTGGIDFDSSDGVRGMAKRQADLAISEAEVVLLVTDVMEGVVSLDIEIAAMLRKAGKKVILVANKADNEQLASSAAAFHVLGFPSIFAVSAAHGLGISTLADEIAAGAPAEKDFAVARPVRVAVVGKPNVGKSSCVNKILREERMIVHETPGTTRDAVDTEAVWRGHPLTLIDTAGLRREGRVKEAADFFSLSRTRKAIRRCDVVLMLYSAVEEVGGVEEKLARHVLDQGRGCVLGINKWDLVKEVSQREYRQLMWNRMQFINFAPLVFLSAKTGFGIDRTLETVLYVHEQTQRRIATPLLNNVLHAIWDRNAPPFRGGQRCKFYYGTQLGVSPPSFALFVNDRKLLDTRYESYLVNNLRRAFGFEGTPVRLEFRNRRE
ncbi:MAG: ribosome biogenesis GTPase Der [Candidatus Aureabacteria bacterium]|nr:ribosome biogenesis GTPase Der [Candidatus Auribacterota bacterium]